MLILPSEATNRRNALDWWKKQTFTFLKRMEQFSGRIPVYFTFGEQKPHK